MKSDFLRELGVTDQKIIDSIMAENGRDITKAQKDYDAVCARVEGLEAQLTERDSQLKDLKKSAKDNESLIAKITELETANTTMKNEYESKLNQMKRDNEVEGKLRDAKAKNIKAVRALLDLDGDIDKQIETLKSAEDSKFLFEAAQTTQTNPPAGTTPPAGNTTTNTTKTELSFADKISAALKKG